MNGNVKCSNCTLWRVCPRAFHQDITDTEDQFECAKGIEDNLRMKTEEAISYLTQERLLQHCKGKLNTVDAIDRAIADMTGLLRLTDIVYKERWG